ncbi:hypothetical protein GX48_05165 [Paracoccidioides brasiliensis]|nr:hypothetical protein GX48_05165 [Paracoccidioides brasiliensis]
MPLLNLPPELLQPIFDFCSVTSCLQAAYTCRTLFIFFSNYRKGLLHQLSRLPSYPNTTTNGTNDCTDLSSKTTAELFLLLRRRAAQQLCGANFHANQSVYTFGEGQPVIDTLASAIRPQLGDPNVALVQKGFPHVYLYFISGGQVLARDVLQPVMAWPGRVEVIKVVFGDDGHTISVLQRYIPLQEGESEDGNENWNERRPDHPFVEEAMKPYRKESTQLVHYRRLPSRLGYSRVTISAFPALDQYRPLAMAVADRDLVAISWQHRRDPAKRKVIVHTEYPDAVAANLKISYQVYNNCVIIDKYGTIPYNNNLAHQRNAGYMEPVIQMSLNDNSTQLLYYHPSSTIYSSYQHMNVEYGSMNFTSGLLRNSCWVHYYHLDRFHNYDDWLDLMFTVAIPFFSTHHTYTEPSNREFCHWKYLTLGTATDENGKLVACLLKAEAHCRSHNCQHEENLDRGRRFDTWAVVARLAGYSMSVNSLPGIVATSRSAMRLAIANWKTIKVWAINPEAIIENNLDGVYPPNMIDEVTTAVLLEPIVLESDAVCFMMRFTEEGDEIVALTDRGVMRWEIGAGSYGRREKGVLEIPNAVEEEEEEESLSVVQRMNADSDEEQNYNKNNDDDDDSDDDDDYYEEEEEEIDSDDITSSF